MTQAQQDILDYIDSLRKDYVVANEERRAEILEEIDHLTQVNRLVKCRWEKCKRLMFNEPTDPHYPFHSAPCHKEWADENYGSVKTKETKRRKTIAEVRKELLNKAKEKHISKGTQTQLYD